MHVCLKTILLGRYDYYVSFSEKETGIPSYILVQVHTAQNKTRIQLKWSYLEYNHTTLEVIQLFAKQ